MSKAFTGGDRMAKALDLMARKLGREMHVKTGFLENSTTTDGKSLPMVAAANEFGTNTIPPRPFFRQMVAKEKGAWGKQLGAALKTSEMDGKKALTKMGVIIKDELQASIVGFNSVPLAPATIKRKGNAAQLIDTGHMLNSVDFEVEGS